MEDKNIDDILSEYGEFNREFKENWSNDECKYEYMYHFTSIDSLIKILLTDSFRLSLVEKMNDINESQPIYKRFGFKVDENELKDIKEKEEDIRSRTFLGCFNILKEEENIRDKVSMWGHYGDSCRGVCLEIDKNKLDRLLFNKIYDNENDVPKNGLYIAKFNIKYKNQTEINNKKKIFLRLKGEPTHVKRVNVINMFKLKSEEWKVENEFRYLVYNESRKKMNYFAIKKFTSCINKVFIGDMQDEQSMYLLKCIKRRLALPIKFSIREGNEEIEI